MRAFLIDNTDWKIAFFSDYFVKFEAARVRAALPQIRSFRRFAVVAALLNRST